MPPKEDAAETKRGGIDKQTVITVSVVIVLLAILRLPMCALQVLMIGIVSIKWEEDSWLATGPNRPARLCCQFWMILIPFGIFVWLIILIVQSASAAKDPVGPPYDQLIPPS